MDAPDQKIVTLASLRRPPSASESAAESVDARSPDDRLKEARYEQVMQRLQDATDDVGGDVVITVQDREVSLAQSRIAELATEARELTSGGQRSSSAPGSRAATGSAGW